MPIITLLTDFGLEDGYVASMKGVILGISPDVRLVDLSHLIVPHGIRSGAFVLSSAYHCFPWGTIHVAVVDPGVGTTRNAIALRTPDYMFVGPDNGLFSWIMRKESKWECRVLENPACFRSEVSMTFHGRDIFAPVAAHLAAGFSWEMLGATCQPQMAEWTAVRHVDCGLSGEIVHVDHFGNAITNITYHDLNTMMLEEGHCLKVKNTMVPVMATTYGEVEKNVTVALMGSSGHLEIAVNHGSAAQVLGLSPGDPVELLKAKSGFS